ncbi:RNA-guided endonuclease InsQ/TnpB family protein [Salmonirosea aquatica]
MQYTTYQFRIKDSTSGKHLTRMGYSCNFVWNYCNEVNQERWKKFRKTFTNFELNKLTAGCSKDLGIAARTIEAVCQEYADKCKQHKMIRLKWRSRKRSLGWVPFKGNTVKVKDDTITYYGHTFRFWLSRPIEGVVRFGSFTQNSKGHWFVNLTMEVADSGRIKTGKECGIDLGLKTIATLSDGVEFSRENLTKKYEKKLAMAQRARKKKRVTAIHAKIRNKRRDWNHKASTRLVQEYDRIIVGDVSSSKLIKTRQAKSVSDAGWHGLKQMLAYKANRLGVEVRVVKESWSTVTCSSCSKRTGPRGLGHLAVREWVCSSCGSTHSRDVNAAKNILLFSLSGMTGQLREASTI